MRPTRDQTARRRILLESVRECGGVARVTTLVEGGLSRRDVSSALDAGGLVRVRRNWVAIPDADPMLVAAARERVVITCVSAARRAGLWVLDDDRPHVGADPHRGGPAPARAIVHWSDPVVPRHPDLLVDPLLNALAIVAQCQPREAALMVWESALNRGLVDAQVLARFDLPGVARRVLAASSPWSDSGLETRVLHRLSWLKVRIIPQAWIAGHRCDFLIGDRLVLQVDGGTHVGVQRTSDIRHDAELMKRGYHVIRVGYAQVIDDWPGVQDLVMHAIAQGLHRAA